MHRNHGIDAGTEVTEGSRAWRGIPVGSGLGVPHRPEKLQRTSNTITAIVPLIFRIWFSVFPIGIYCPWAYSTAVSHPTSRLCVDCRNSVCRNRVCRNSVVYPLNRTPYGRTLHVFQKNNPGTHTFRCLRLRTQFYTEIYINGWGDYTVVTPTRTVLYSLY